MQLEIDRKVIFLLPVKFFLSETIIRVGPSVRDRYLFVNLGILELTYRLQTFRDHSFSILVPCEKRSNSIINTERLYGLFRYEDFDIFNSLI